MPDYQYNAINEAGKQHVGVINAADKKNAMTALSKQGLRVLELKSSSAAADSLANSGCIKISGGEVLALMFFKKVYQLCKGGMPVADTLKSLGQRSLNPSMKALSRALYKSMSEGSTLANAMAVHPKIFEVSLVHLCEAGEATANLVPIFKNVIDYLEGKRRLRANLQKAMIYPAVLCVMALCVMLFFLFFMLPKIKDMLEKLDGELNLPIKILMAFGDAVIYGGPVFLIILAVVVFCIYRVRMKESGRIMTDKISYNAPVVGDILRNSNLARLANLMSTLFSSGVNTTETMRLAEKTIKNSYLRLQFQQCRMAINDGAPIAQSFKNFKVLDDDDVDILAVGDRIGSLVEGFAEIYAAHMEILDAKIKQLTVWLSSVALIIALLIVALLAIGIVSSVQSVTQNLL